MRARLRLLVRSFNEAVSEYTLARLEVAAATPHAAVPPALVRLVPASRGDDGLASRWRDALAQVADVPRFIRAADQQPGNRAWSSMEHAARAAAQYARGIALVADDARTPASGEQHP